MKLEKKIDIMSNWKKSISRIIYFIIFNEAQVQFDGTSCPAYKLIQEKFKNEIRFSKYKVLRNWHQRGKKKEHKLVFGVNPLTKRKHYVNEL